MRAPRFVITAACTLAVLVFSAAALAQSKAQPARPATPVTPKVLTAQLQVQTQAPYTTLLTSPRADPRAARMGQYPMPIARTDVTRFNMPVSAGDPANYPIRIIRPEGDSIALETAPPVGVPVEPKLLEPVRLKFAPARPSLSK